MTKQMRAKRMSRLIISFVAILSLVAILRWGAAQVEVVSPRPKIAAKVSGLVVVNGVEYRPTLEVSRYGREFRQTYRANVEVRDPSRAERLWKVVIREATWPEAGQGMLSFSGGNDDRIRSCFALTLAVQGRVICATTPDGGEYLLDPETRQVREVKAPSPPPKPPILEACASGKTRCEVHGRKLLEDVVPIRYGFGILQAGTHEARTTRFPNANSSVWRGCVVGPSSEARVLYCPDCRDSEGEWAESPTVEPVEDEDGEIRSY
jgi:hypothetical protein